MDYFRRGCVVQDDEFFDLRTVCVGMRSIEFLKDKKSFCARTLDGYQIEIIKMAMLGMCWFNGYVAMPPESFVLQDVYKTSQDYSDFQTRIGIRNVELTYGNHQATIGWDHGHLHDFNFFASPDTQQDRLVSGPVQVMDEALRVVEVLRDYEDSVLSTLKRSQTRLLFPELMEKALHPSRVERWILAGVE